MTAIATMTAATIESRLAELEEAQAAFDARDFDGELSAALMKGADLDALEDEHLEAERIARRIRVERAALESALPDAQAREGGDQLAAMAKDHQRLEKRATKARDAILKAWGMLDAALAEWQDVQGEAFDAGNRAVQIAQQSKAPMPEQAGTFQSAALVGIIRDLQAAPSRLVSVEHAQHTRAGLLGHRID